MSPLSINSWIESLDPEPPVKRRRCNNVDDDCGTSDYDFTYPYNAPNTPPSANSNADMLGNARGRGRKRVGEALGGNDNLPGPLANETPNLRPTTLVSQAPSSRDPSPPKRPRSTSPIKARIDLQRLEKPVQISDLEEDDTSVLPTDVQTLYARLRIASELQSSIVPIEVRSHIFGRGPVSGSDSAAPDPVQIATAEAVLSRIRRIRHQAAISTKQQRHECAWNNLVHTPLLQLAFESEPVTTEPDLVSVRFEPVMSVPIARDSIPRIRQVFTGSDVGSVLAWSVSDESTSTGQTTGDFNPAQIRASSDNKKVDYVVVLDVANDTPFKQTIFNLILSHWNGSPAHVNQTVYPSISDSPIGLSIETKTVFSSRDPLLQLGIWVAAWHKRMNDLRLSRLRQCLSVGTATAPETTRLVSVPMIVVTGHNWDVYFACDQGSSIMIRGPIPVGSTSTVLQIYALLASLTAIKEWMKTTYFEGIKEWFMCEAVVTPTSK